MPSRLGAFLCARNGKRNFKTVSIREEIEQVHAQTQTSRRHVDDAVAAAYDWDAGTSENETLRELLALNLENGCE